MEMAICYPCGQDGETVEMAGYDGMPSKSSQELVSVPMYEVSRLDHVCRNIIAICEIMSKDISKDRIVLIRQVLSGYMLEIDERYMELVKELKKFE